MLKSVRYRLGHWIFVPSGHELRSGQARVRLERRASATLSLLALVAAFLLTQRGAGSARPEVAVAQIENATGTDRFRPLMRACNETVLVDLGKHSSSFTIVEAASAAAGARRDYVLQQ